MTIRKDRILVAIMSLLAIIGCSNDEMTGRNALCEVEASFEETFTRVGLSTLENSHNLLAKWQEGDQMNIILHANGKYYEVGPVPVREISDDGRSCKFSYRLPDNFDNPSDGYQLMCFTSNCQPKIIDNEVYYNGSLIRKSISQFKASVMSDEHVSSGVFQSKFKHDCTYELLHIINNSGKDIDFAVCGFSADAIWYRTLCAVRNWDGKAVYPSEAAQAAVEESPNVKIPANSSDIIVSSYIPNGQLIKNAKLTAKINGEYVYTSNLFSSNVQLKRGHAYHMYITWDGKDLRFTDGKDDQHGSAPESQTITLPGTNISFNMIAVEGGTFWMGSADDDSEADNNERPRHQVTLSSYAIGETEVTQALWEAVMGSNPSHYKGSNRPVEYVSWDECQTFISKLNSLTGRNFRLPTEAEWEYAARGGKNSKGYKYAGSNDIDSVAWYYSNCSSTHPVAEKQANELGLYDMSGNVMEWCQDWYNSSYYSYSPSTNPCNTTEASLRVRRGGGEGNFTNYCRVADRGGTAPSSRYWNVGLRLALGTLNSDDTQAHLTCPDDHHPHLIDLGLPSGTKWACCNVGAHAPEEYGGYYAWGETEEKDVYNWSTYKHCDGSQETCHDLGSDIAGTQYDVAHVKWDGSWVMPSVGQFEELLNNCSSQWTTLNAVNGLKFIGKNGGSIFLPRSGYRNYDELYFRGGCGNYWSGTLSPDFEWEAYTLGFYVGYTDWYDAGRDGGLSVRPVSE